MQVEAKIVLHTASDFAFVCESLKENFMFEDKLENHFFDSPELILSKSGAHLRLRFAKDKCILSLKEHATYEGGTATRWSKEANIDVTLARVMLGDPTKLLMDGNDNNVVETLKTHFTPNSLRNIGGFVTKRQVYQWKECKSQPGLVMRLDYTEYPFGQRFEIEVPDILVPVQDVLDEIALALDSLNVSYSMAQESKLQAFLNGNQAALAKSHLVQDAKLVLKNKESFELLSARLRPSYLSIEEQENYFFDGLKNELYSSGAHLRVRVVDGKCIAVLKEHQGINDGSSIYWGRQLELPRTVFEEMLRSPTTFLEINSPVVQTLKSNFNINGLRFIGSFRNTRKVFDWSSAASQAGLLIYLDHTTYPFGERFEVEVPNIEVPLSDVIGELTNALDDLGVECTAGVSSKFNLFFSGITTK